uniref:Serine beta-lactamase-like protein LACTB, mitochondrial n=1 Tax=Phallusia mammillata TaxID=59560 RepID=A0A6F9DJQ2_9ASCI|nr:serine beta-lactamase-like protein LACTB, mitochondrial [Phallusia mammillata]
MFRRTCHLLASVTVANLHSEESIEIENHLKSTSASSQISKNGQIDSESVIHKCQAFVKQKMLEAGAPGMVVAVSENGNLVWCQGFGYADVENSVHCHPDTIMRVASISKSFTASAFCRLWQNGLIDLDKPIQEYVPDYPQKSFKGKKVDITLRQLLSHSSGTRHYEKTLENEDKIEEYLKKEYYSAKQYDNVTDALNMFKNDDLMKEPGRFFYTTHGYTLVSAAMEKAAGKDFLILMQDHFQTIGMTSTIPDYNDRLVYGRSRFYVRNDKGKLQNAPHVNNSYKWAGGGFLSSVKDLVQFGDAMMYSFQTSQACGAFPGLHNQETMKKMWSSIAYPEEKKSPENLHYGLGWFVSPEADNYGCCQKSRLEIDHTGGAIGASSVLFLLPDPPQDAVTASKTELVESNGGIYNSCPVRGVSVAIITNMQNVGLRSLARRIAYEFKGCGYDACV